jgi:hypothetical protein
MMLYILVTRKVRNEGGAEVHAGISLATFQSVDQESRVLGTSCNIHSGWGSCYFFVLYSLCTRLAESSHD